ncbi:MAG: SH3 domain-containing protein [Anaerolineales bacterium]|nr:SH3 domain-containing protein [Anaerolineales bacterium]
MVKSNLLWGLLGAVIVACCLGFGVIVLARGARATSSALYPTAIVEIIPAPTLTPSPVPTPSIVPQAGGDSLPISSSNGDAIHVGDSVQIYGTQGDGLRLRANPGLEGQILFLAYEGEIFQVEDGPRQASGYVWWYLVAPYDENVKGWAVENYLRVVD